MPKILGTSVVDGLRDDKEESWPEVDGVYVRARARHRHTWNK